MVKRNFEYIAFDFKYIEWKFVWVWNKVAIVTFRFFFTGKYSILCLHFSATTNLLASLFSVIRSILAVALLYGLCYGALRVGTFLKFILLLKVFQSDGGN